MTREEACMASLREFFSRGESILEWGVAPARPTPHAALLRSWVEQGHHAGMDYMAARLGERMDPQAFHPWAESAIMFAFPYGRSLGSSGDRYKVASYARCEDYHATARAHLRAAEAHLRSEPALSDIRFYGFADTAPMFERDLASEAGIGWRGKNCCTLNRKHGSAFHLAGFLLDIPLEKSAPLQDFCGGCTRCLDQCPTGAFLAPGRLDANKCISYWTIEARGDIPADLSSRFQGWIFGCDICQEVCPWNHKGIRTNMNRDGLPESGPDWAALLRKGGGFRSQFRRSPLNRAGRRNLLRNLGIAIRNLGDISALDPLAQLLPEETDPIVRAELERTIAALGDMIRDGNGPGPASN